MSREAADRAYRKFKELVGAFIDPHVRAELESTLEEPRANAAATIVKAWLGTGSPAEFSIVHGGKMHTFTFRLADGAPAVVWTTDGELQDISLLNIALRVAYDDS